MSDNTIDQPTVGQVDQVDPVLDDEQAESAEETPSAYSRLSDPTQKIDMWGPRTLDRTEGYLLSAPRKKKAWGLADIGWAIFAVVMGQVILLPLLALLAIAKYDIAMDSPGAADQLTDAITDVVTTGPGLILAVVSQWAAFVGVPLWASARKGHRSLAKDFGLVFKWRDIPLGFALAFGLQLLMTGISYLLNLTSLDLSDADNTGQVTDQVGLVLVFMIFAASFGAPLTEELLFRGLILRAFLRKIAKVDLAPPLPGVTDHFHPAEVSERRRKVGTIISVLLTSAFFGVMHLQTGTNAAGGTTLNVGAWVVVAQTGLLGLFFAIVAVKSRRLGLPIVAHFFFNSASIALVLLTT